MIKNEKIIYNINIGSGGVYDIKCRKNRDR